ncbi:5-hydroxytryptamine receptor 4 [Mactra antiquata]
MATGTYYNNSVHSLSNLSVVYSAPGLDILPDNVSEKDDHCAEVLAGTSGPPRMFDPTVRYVISGILFIFPCLTMLGNGMVIVAVLTHKRLKTVTNAFVVSLAVADIMVAILVMPFGIYQQFNNKTWKLGRTWCLITTSFDVMFTTTSIFNLSCLAVDRYLAICRPFIHERLTRPKVIMMLSFCWVVPIFISFVPIMKYWNHIGIEEYVKCAFPPDDPTHCGFVVNKVFATVCSLIAFYIPTVFIVICNVHIFSAARKQAHQIRSLELSAHKHHRKDPFIGYKIPYDVWTVALWLGYINSMLNPFLYYNFNRHYKMAFRRLLTCKVCRGISEYTDDVVPSSLYTDLSHSASSNSHSCLHNGAGRHSLPHGHNNNNVGL